MATYTVPSFAELEKLLRKHNKQRMTRCRKVVKRCAAHMRRHVIAHTIPIAFRTLEHSLHVEVSANRIALVADAPHAESVEIGSRPHRPPLGPLIEWVKLRGMQGQANRSKGGGRYSRGTTTKMHARRISQSLNSMAQQQGGSNEVDDPVRIAVAIQNAIAKSGTKPQWYMRSALPEVNEFFDREFRIAMADVEKSGKSSAATE